MIEQEFGYPSMGPGVGVDVDPTRLDRRTGTKSALDFAYWVAQNVEPIATWELVPEATTDSLNGVELVLFAADQVGIVVPETATLDALYAWCASTQITVAEALTTRGALLFCDTRVAVTLGFGKIVDSNGDRYYFGIPNNRTVWTTGALVPGVIYR